MAKLAISDFLIYRWRYVLGYGTIALILIAGLLLAGLYIPGGLTQGEMASASASGALKLSDPATLATIHLPYRLLQHASIELFGLSILSIKLPSLLLGFLSAVGMLLLLRIWFKHNVALLASILTITTGQFLLIAQSGTPSIMYVFWSIWILLAATMVSRAKTPILLWKIILFVSIALSLYTPLSIYIIITLLVATVLHPHLRYVVRRLSKAKLLSAAVLSLILTVPLGYALIKNPSLALELLGIPEAMPNVGNNLVALLQQYLNFVSPESGRLMLPLFGFGSLALILLGIFRLVTSRYTARSYTITIWLVLLTPILIINPTYTSVTFVPLLLLMATGLEALIREWYKLFPRNPYARLAGLLPLSLLLITLVYSGLDRYFYGYHYDPKSTVLFSRDVRLVTTELKRTDTKSPILVVSDVEKPFYDMLLSYPPRGIVQPTTVTTELPSSEQVGTGTVLVSKQSGKTATVQQPVRILTSSLTSDADRWYVYSGANTIQ